MRGHPELLPLTQGAEWVGISVITHLEFLAFPGISAEDTELFARFLERIEVIDLDHRQLTLLQTAIALRQSYRLRLPDAVIVASALVRNACLVTADRTLLNLARRSEKLLIHEFNPVAG